MRGTNLRGLIYPVVVIPILAVAALAIMLCVRAGDVPSSIVNSRVAQWLAGRVGVQYSIRSMRFGCFQPDCGTIVDAGGLEVAVPEVGQLRVALDGLHWCPVHPVSIRGLSVSATGIPRVFAGDLSFSTATMAAEVRDIRIEPDTIRPIRIQRVASSPATINPVENRLSIDRLEIAGVNAEVGGRSTPSSFCGQAQTMFAARDDMAALAQSGRAWLNRVAARTKQDLLILSFIVPAVLFLLKLFATAWMRWRIRLALTAASVALPLATYALLGNTLGLRELAGTAFAGSLVLAVVSWARHYRKAGRGYQRWEPFTIDLACFTIVLPLVAYNFDFTPRFEVPAAVEVGSVEVTDTSLDVNTSRCGESQLVQTRIANLAVENLAVGLPNDSEQVTVLKIAAIRAPDIELDVPDAQISGLRADVENVSFAVDGQTRQIRQLEAGFRAEGTVNGGSADRVSFTVGNGSVAFVPDSCEFKYAADLQVVTEPINAAVALDGDMKAIRLRRLRTLPGSIFDVADGSGTISFAGNLMASLRLSGIRAGGGNAQVRVASTDLAATLPPLCSAGAQKVVVALNNTDIAGNDGWALRLAGGDIDFSRDLDGKTSVNVALGDMRFSTQAPAIAATLPAFHLALAGMTTGAVLPRSFTGELRFSAGRPGDVILDHESPLKFSSDFMERTLTIPLQSQVFHQRAVPGLPTDISLHMSASRRPNEDIDLFINLPRLALPAGPVHAEINDLEVARTRGVLNFKTQWNRVTLPALPAAFCLEAISRFNLSTAGEINGFTFPERTPSYLGATIPCADIPRLPGAEEFRFAGTLPGAAGQPVFRIERRAGGVIDIGRSQSHLQRLELLDGRFQALELESNSTGIRIAGRAGESSSKTNIAVTAGGVSISSAVSRTDSDVLEWTLDTMPGRVHLEALQGKQRNALTADAWFEGSELMRLRADARLPGGSLASANGLNISNGNSTISFNMENDAVSVSADVSGVVSGRDSAGGTVEGRVDLGTELHGRLYKESMPSRNRVLDLASRAAADFGRHYRKVFPETPRNGSFAWDLSLANSEEARPLLRIDPDQISFRLAADIRGVRSDAFSATGRVGFDGDLRIHEGQLVADAYAPVYITTSGSTLPFSTLNLDLPVLVALSDSLKTSGTPERLWDADYYERFWSTYKTDQSSRGTISLIDNPRVVVGPLSVRDVTAPVEPLRIAIGHSGGVGLHVPLAARLLHGTARGFLDAAVSWPNDRMALQSRLNLSLRNMQAGAIGLVSDSGHLPLLEHELDGDVSLSTEGWPLTLDAANFSLDFRTSARNQGLPGILQMRSGTTVTTLNQVLDKIIRDLQLRVPPSAFGFRNLALRFAADKGKVRTDKPWLELDGLRVFSSDDLSLDANIRLHGARNGETVDLRGLLGDFQIPSGAR